MRARRPVLRVMLAAVSLAAAGARAQDVRVNEFTGGEEGLSVVASASTFRVVWRDHFEFCGGASTPAMREVNRAGAFLTGDTMVGAVCGGMWEKYAIAMHPSGEFIVVANTPSIPGDLRARVFDAAGSPRTGDLVVNQTPRYSSASPAAAVAATGGFAIVWSDEEWGGGGGLYGRLIQGDGSMPAPQVTVKAPVAGVTAFSPRLAALSSGGFVSAWLDVIGSPGDADVVARYFDGALAPVGLTFPVSQATSPPGWSWISLASSGDAYVIVWDRGPSGTGDVYARWFDRSQGALGNEVRVNSYTTGVQGGPQCQMDAFGGAIVLWLSYDQDGSSFGVFSQRFDAGRAPWGPEFRVNMTTWNQQTLPTFAMLPSGDFYATWSSETGAPLTGDCLARRFFFPISLVLARGPGAGNGPLVGTYRPDGRPGFAPWNAYGTGGYGAQVGSAGLDADALAELLTGPGPSPVFGPQVRAFEGDGTALAKVSFYAYGTLRYGVKVGGANVDADVYDEIVTTPGPGAVFGPHLRGWNYDGTAVAPIPGVNLFCFSTLKYGCNASRGNVDGDAFDELLAAPGPGPMFGAQVRGFNVDGGSAASIAKINFYAFNCRHGAEVGAADVESDGIGGYGDGFQEILAGTGPDPACTGRVALFDYDGAQVARKYEVSPYATSYGVKVAGGDVDAGDTEELATAPAADPATAARVLCWEWNPLFGTNPDGATLQTIGTDDFTPFPASTYGANVAVGKFE